MNIMKIRYFITEFMLKPKQTCTCRTNKCAIFVEYIIKTSTDLIKYLIHSKTSQHSPVKMKQKHITFQTTKSH